MGILDLRQQNVEWLREFVKLEGYRKIRYLNIYYPPPLGKPFLREQRHCVVVDDFKESPIGVIDYSGYHYVKKEYVHGETTVQVDNFIYATYIYKIFVCLKETVALRLDKFEPFYDETFRERRIVEAFCDIIINEYEAFKPFIERIKK